MAGNGFGGGKPAIPRLVQLSVEMVAEVDSELLKVIESRVQASALAFLSELLNQSVLPSVDCARIYRHIREIGLGGLPGGDVLLDLFNGPADILFGGSADARAEDSDHNVGFLEDLAVDDALRMRAKLRRAAGFPLKWEENHLAN